MNRSLIVKSLGLGIVLLAAVLWLARTPVPDVPSVPSTAGKRAVPEPVFKETSDFAGPERLESESVQVIRQRIATLEQALEASIELRSQAEEALEASESEVEQLEAFVEEIEMRGEDPADYAEEGMERFQPAFFRYQDAAAAYEQAQALEREARAALAEAKAEMVALDAEGAER